MNRNVLVMASVLALVGCGFVAGSAVLADEPKADQPAQTNPGVVDPAPKTPGTPETTKPETKPGEDHPIPEETRYVYVSMKTSKGEIVLQLDNEKAPISVKNFLDYTEQGFYNGTIFHRVIADFMIQGGGFTPDMTQKQPSAKEIKNEWKNGLKNTKGTVAMARLGNRPDSATCQFFINVKDNAFLDQPNDGAGYAVFGKVVSGMDVVDAIKGVPTADKGGHGDVPREPIVIETVTKLSGEDAKKYTK